MKWIIVTGAGIRVSEPERETAWRLGALLGREGYGLIAGTWGGVDEAVTRGFLAKASEVVRRIRHVLNSPFYSSHSIRVGSVIASSPQEGYSSQAIAEADAGVIISGRKGSKPTMDALLKAGKPVVPLAWFANDAFYSLQDLLVQSAGRRRSKRLFLSLVDPACSEDETVSRILGAVAGPRHSIFISYHRNDTGPDAGRLANHLSYLYGSGRIFIDYDSLAAAAPLNDIIGLAEKARVLLLLMGRHFQQCIQSSNNFVLREVNAAREAGVLVLPVLVDVAFREVGLLPDTLQFLSSVRAVTLAREEWETSMAPIESAIDKALGITRMQPFSIPIELEHLVSASQRLLAAKRDLREERINSLTSVGQDRGLRTRPICGTWWA